MIPASLWLRAQAGPINQLGELAGLLPKSWESTAFLIVTVVILLQKKRIESWIGISEVEYRSSIDGKIKYEESMRAALAEKDKEIKELQAARVTQNSERIGQLEDDLKQAKSDLDVERARHMDTFKAQLRADARVEQLEAELLRVRAQRDQLGQATSTAVQSMKMQGLDEESDQITQEIITMVSDLSKPDITIPGVLPPDESKDA